MRIVDGARGRGEGKEIIDGRRDLGGTLVAVPHNTGDPARIGGAAAHDAPDFFTQSANARPVGLRMIGVIDRRRASRQRPHGEREPSYDLVEAVAPGETVRASALVAQ